MTAATRCRAVFVDRDGTLNRERDFLRDPAELELLPGVASALRRLRAAGYAIVIITNQSGVARGYLDEPTLARIHERLHAMLKRIPSGYFHCPHHPEQPGAYGRACRCRKPGVGLIERAVEVLGLQLQGSWVIGDSGRDVLAATALDDLAGGVLVRTGKPWEAQLENARTGGYEPIVTDDLTSAVEHILAADR